MKALTISVAGLVVVAVAVAGFTLWGLEPHQQQGHEPFCFAEWCVAPTGMSATSDGTVVRVAVSSTARASSQRPDHPEAWLVDVKGNMTGGPQVELDRAIGPQESYSAALRFHLTVNQCATFLVGEGAWPAPLGLGYAPSPFTTRAGWKLCLGRAALTAPTGSA